MFLNLDILESVANYYKIEWYYICQNFDLPYCVLYNSFNKKMMHYNFNVFLINYKKDVIFLIDKNLLYEKMFHKPLSFDKYIKCKDKEYCWRLHLLDKIKKYPKHFLLIN